MLPDVLDYGGRDAVLEREIVQPDEEGVYDVVLQWCDLIFLGEAEESC